MWLVRLDLLAGNCPHRGGTVELIPRCAPYFAATRRFQDHNVEVGARRFIGCGIGELRLDERWDVPLGRGGLVFI